MQRAPGDWELGLKGPLPARCAHLTPALCTCLGCSRPACPQTGTPRWIFRRRRGRTAWGRLDRCMLQLRLWNHLRWAAHAGLLSCCSLACPASLYCITVPSTYRRTDALPIPVPPQVLVLRLKTVGTVEERVVGVASDKAQLADRSITGGLCRPGVPAIVCLQRCCCRLT